MERAHGSAVRRDRARGCAVRPLHRRRGRAARREAARLRVGRGRSATTRSALAALADELIRAARNKVVEHEGRKVFAEIFGPPPRLLVYGAVDSADALCAAAKVLGWHTIVADARGMFATKERLPARRRDDRRVARGDVRACAAGPRDRGRRPDARRQVRRAGAVRRARDGGVLHRRARLAPKPGAPTREAPRGRGLGGGVRRISGPCGLDIGADTPAETGISILAEALAIRAGRDGGRLRDAKGRIHVEVT